MRTYIIRRLLLMLPTLFILTMLVFLSLRFIPGDVIDAMQTQIEVYVPGVELDRAALERQLGLDVPVYVQYGRWMGGILLHGTLGHSLIDDFRIEERILGRLPVTLELGFLAIVIGLVIALPVGIYSAVRQDTAADYVGRSIAIIGLATPNFWLALMVMLYPAIWWGWSPSIELIPFTEDPLGNLGMFIIPAAILGTAMAASTMRMTRTMMLEVLRQDYIRTGWSKGSQGAGSCCETRRQERPHPGSYHDRPAVASPGWRLRYHRGNICSAGDRSHVRGRAQTQRLPDGPRSEPVLVRHSHAQHSPCRRNLSLSRPKSPL